MKEKKLRLSIRIKTIIIIVVFGLFLAEIAMFYFSIVSSNRNKDNYKQIATNLSETIALSVDKEKVSNITSQIVSIYDEYETKPTRETEGSEQFDESMNKIATIKTTQDYLDIRNHLYEIRMANDDTEGVYMASVDYDRKLCIYLVYDEDNGDYLVTAGSPIIDNNDEVICYVLVDINMKTVRSNQANIIIKLFIYMISTAILLSIIGIVIINIILVKRIKQLQSAAMSYDINNPEKTHEIFSNLAIKGHDELNDLAHSMKNMETILILS